MSNLVPEGVVINKDLHSSQSKNGKQDSHDATEIVIEEELESEESDRLKNQAHLGDK